MSSMESDPHDLCTCGNYRKDHDGRTAATADCPQFVLALSANVGWEDSCAQCADMLRHEEQCGLWGALRT